MAAREQVVRTWTQEQSVRARLSAETETKTAHGIREFLPWWPAWPEDCDIPLLWRVLLVTAGALTWAMEVARALVTTMISPLRQLWRPRHIPRHDWPAR